MDLKKVTKNVHELKKLNMTKEMLEKQIEALKDEIKSEMTEAETDEILGTDYKVTWKWIHSESFDTKRFKEEHEKLAKRYVKANDTRRFCVA